MAKKADVFSSARLQPQACLCQREGLINNTTGNNALGDRLSHKSHLDVSVCDLVIVKVLDSLQDLLGVEPDGGLVVLQRSPLRSQQSREASWSTRQRGFYANRMTERAC